MWQWIKNHWNKLFGRESTASSGDSQVKETTQIMTRRSSRLVYARRVSMETPRMDTIKTRRRRLHAQ